jgi:hypothetical protein
MIWRRRDPNQRKLDEAQREQAEVRREGAAREPLIRRLETHAKQNHFAERFQAALRRST